jgi:glucans biosynthesis protein
MPRVMKTFRFYFLVLLSAATALRAADGAWTFDRLCAMAAERAAVPYHDDSTPAPATLARLSYDDLRCIEFCREAAVWHAEHLPFEVMMYHPGGGYTQGVALQLLEGGQPRSVPFNAGLFLYHQIPVATNELPATLNYPGFRVVTELNQRGRFDEVISFLGASYFRALGKGQTYGASARGIALRPAAGQAEEFPRFTAFWVERPERKMDELRLFALLDGPSVCGAYQFVLKPGEDTTVQVRAALYARKILTNLGIGTLTSMFWHGKNSPDRCGDFRPEVHDSDGLLVADGDGTWRWRPLQNVAAVRDTNLPLGHLQGFGLFQRDRKFSNYQDTEALYHRRPSVWVEPTGDWNTGRIRLTELPAHGEYGDNVVACWEPVQPLTPGKPLNASWTLHWFMEDHMQPLMARCVNTFVAGRRILLDFAGGELHGVGDKPVAAQVSSDNGATRNLHVIANPDVGGWRVGFDVVPAETNRTTALSVTLRAAIGGQNLSETWMYQLAL